MLFLKHCPNEHFLFHPSGYLTPNKEDSEVTKRISEVGKIIVIDLLDHLIVCPDKITFLKEKGCIYKFLFIAN
ncbi:JAB domain-containing protein [Priestia aryabhattai]|uniref:JAB domain-containing protein n=1 Tax=Priestia aryabhattai TaxID=412384 RepID=UPI002E1B50D2